MWSKITTYEAFDGQDLILFTKPITTEDSFDNQAVRLLCNYDYDQREDYMFTLSKETG